MLASNNAPIFGRIALESKHRPTTAIIGQVAAYLVGT
jgi:hypothetical protein